MDIYQELSEIGLNKSDIKVYMYLLENGLSYPPQIAKGTGITRTNTYNVLRRLQEKGLIEIQKKRKRKAYLATNPEALLRAVEKKKEKIERILPDLKALYNKKENKPTIKFYDGFEQIKEIMNQILDAEEIYTIGSPQQLKNLDPDYYHDLVKKLSENNVISHDILTYATKKDAGKKLKESLGDLQDATFLPQKFDDIPTDMVVWGDNLATLHYEEPVFGTVITNQKLADSFKIIVKTLKMWAPEKQKEIRKPEIK
ncbi:MAG: TrmB family transcriptional regulator [Candidatus Paceibacteria bacterium]